MRVLAITGLAIVSGVAAVMLAGCGAHRVADRVAVASAAVPPQASVPADAIRDAREQAALDSSSAAWPYETARLCLAADSLAAAGAALEMALERDPCHAPSLSLASKLDYDAGRHDRAIERLEGARARADCFPDDLPASLLLGLALHYQAAGRRADARELVGALPRPLPAEARSAVVSLMLLGASPDSAAPHATAALAAEKQSAVHLNNHAITLLRAGNPEAARSEFLAAIERDPKLAGPYYNLAILEQYYTFDEAAAARWFTAYRERAAADPDSLAPALERARARDLAEGGKR